MLRLTWAGGFDGAVSVTIQSEIFTSSVVKALDSACESNCCASRGEGGVLVASNVDAQQKTTAMRRITDGIIGVGQFQYPVATIV
eukprot:m.98956 g.98956  ORF g.98956 m.98956 type:complete len:85 (-) comp27116_c0_seq1:114-368(-)